MNKYNEILSLYVGDCDIRAHFSTPFNVGDRVFATDAHSLVFFDKNLCDIVENQFPDNKYKDVPNVIPQDLNIDKVITIGELERLISLCPLVPEIIIEETETKCETCNGSGSVEWTFEIHEKIDDCPECEGDGHKTTETEKQTENLVLDLKYVKIFDAHIIIYMIDRLAKTAKLLGENNIHLRSYAHGSRALLFRVKDVYALIMPCMTPDDHLNIIGTIN